MVRSEDVASVRRRRLLQSLPAAGAATILAGCSDGGDGGEGGDGGGDETAGGGDGGGSEGTTSQFVIGSTSGASGGLDPIAVGDEVTLNRLHLLYDGGGVIHDDPIGFQGRWLADWELSEDATTVRYTVREGLEWGAGYGQLTAETYVYNVEHVFTADWAGYSQRPYFSVGGEPIEYERTGELTFEATLPEPRVNFLHEDPITSVLLLPADLLAKYEPAEGETPETPARDGIARDPDVAEARIAGNLGPFTLDSYEKGSQMVVSANEDYYLADTDVDGGAFRDSPKVGGVTTEVFGERSTAYSALKAGDVHTTGIEARRKAEFEDAAGVKLWTSTYGDYLGWISINHRVNGWAPLRESRDVRQAFAHFVDRRTLIEDIFDGNANPVDTFHPRWGPYYSDAKIRQYDHDPQRARELLESGTSADYGYDGSGRFVGPDGEQVELRLVTRSDLQTGELVGNYLRQTLEDAGFAVTVDGLPFDQILGTYFANSVENNANYSGEPEWSAGRFNGGPWDQSISAEPWDFVYGVGSNTAAYAPWQAVQGFVAERGTFNAFGYHTDDFDFAGAIDDAASAATREEATTVLEDMFGFLSEDLPFLWTRNNHRIVGYREEVGGLPEVRNFFSEPNLRLVSLD